ncbi:MAG TPA: tyrosine-type recombinase/integrase [Gemmataceae bacterium]|nr:tyrosine-type recombinase/integrase [Gemmataceae bacterium]
MTSGRGGRPCLQRSVSNGCPDLDADPPTATVGAGYTKNKRPVLQPLPPDLAQLLQHYLRDKPAGQPVWPGDWARMKRAAAILRIDLKAAGVPYFIDAPDGPLYADFHALRHTYITYLDHGGVSLRTAQEMARHSTPTLTARYSHPRLNDMASAAEKLPRFLQSKPDGPADSLRATGTDGNHASQHVAQHVGPGHISLHRAALPCKATKKPKARRRAKTQWLTTPKPLQLHRFALICTRTHR